MTKKPNVVVILGAGASADFGVPTLRGIFKNTYARKYLATHQELARQLQDVFWGPRGHTVESSDDTLTIEEMLTILGDCERIENLPHASLGVTDVAKLRKELSILLFNAIYVGRSTTNAYLNPLLGYARVNFANTTWATFNWDCVFEASFWYSSGPQGYATRANPTLAIDVSNWRQGFADHLYLKLHGGINWWMEGGRLSYQNFGGTALRDRWAAYEAGTLPADYFPAILEPSAYKYQDPLYKVLEPQWEKFFWSLVSADAVLVVGYSLPVLDPQARAKLTLGFQLNSEACWGVVDPSAQSRETYARLLGTKRLRTFDQGLVAFNVDLAANIAALLPILPQPE